MIRIVCLALTVGAAAGCAAPTDSSNAAPTAPPVAVLEVTELSATEARDRMAAGTLTSRALTEAYRDRIAKLDDAGPRLDAVIELNPAASASCNAAGLSSITASRRGPASSSLAMRSR